jgi:hypothetical protein
MSLQYAAGMYYNCKCIYFSSYKNDVSCHVAFSMPSQSKKKEKLPTIGNGFNIIRYNVHKKHSTSSRTTTNDIDIWGRCNCNTGYTAIKAYSNNFFTEFV